MINCGNSAFKSTNATSGLVIVFYLVVLDQTTAGDWRRSQNFKGLTIWAGGAIASNSFVRIEVSCKNAWCTVNWNRIIIEPYGWWFVGLYRNAVN